MTAHVEDPTGTEPVHGRGGALGLTGLSIGALGIVYGDIGTSPLYAFRETFEGHELEVTRDGVLGGCSLAFWALILIITIKYLLVLMRADQKGEGGIMALRSLLPSGQGGRTMVVFLAAGIFGTAMLYGDGMITPAISVLAAVEGLNVATSSTENLIIPIALTILVGLFLLQRRGTAGIARVFGPIMLVWFFTLAMLGVNQVLRTPDVLAAVNPIHAIRFFGEYGWHGFWSLGSIFLVVTGGEALYADMGHFGRRPIRISWFTLVLPALVLNYFGQGALLLADPEAIRQPFFLLAPDWAIWPLVLLATTATVVASQALISGAFSLTTQAMQSDFLPRVKVQHTSESQMGQVYVPIVNWLLMLSCIGLVLGFRSSSNLAAAYGVAVTISMTITTTLLMGVAMHRWRWPRWVTLLFGLPLLGIDLAFVGSQLVKIPMGGWVALVIGIGQFVLMTTWNTGRRILAQSIHRGETPIGTFLADLDTDEVHRVHGTAVFLFKERGSAPPALLVNVTHNRVLHERVLLLSIITEPVSHVLGPDRCTVNPLGEGLWEVVLRFGYRDEPNVPEALRTLPGDLAGLDLESITYFLGRESIVAAPKPNMSPWRERLFVLQTRTAASAGRFFHLPADRVFEVGTTVEI